MSEELNTVDFGADPLTAAGSEANEQDLREYAAALVRNGMSVGEANKHLTARKAAPLAANASELAVQSKERLLGDEEFVARYMRGDADAVAQLTALDLKISRGDSKLTDRELAPADYDFSAADYRLAGNAPEDVQSFKGDFAALSAGLKLSQDHATALLNSHRDAVEITGRMSEVEREVWGRDQAAVINAALGADADKQIADAEATLQKARGGKMDLKAIVKTNGANVALQLIQQAQHLRATGRG
jgi:hypothetical protein